MKMRPLSLRAFDDSGMMIDAGLAMDDEIEPLIQRFFANPDVAYIQAHNATRGCYSGRIDRVR